jgi:hypothetical protein
MKLNFNRIIPEEDLISRVMGPDEFGGYSYVQAVYHSPEGREGMTVCDMHPLAPGEDRLVRDEFGQLRVAF